MLDYKTDQVKSRKELVEKYHAQLEYYAHALSQLTGKNCKREDYLFVYFKRGDHRMKILMYCLLALNVGVWLMYGIDKWKAKSGRWRIPEKVLLLAAFAGGSVGALAGMMMFRHKTKKAKFVISVPIFFVIHCVIAGYVLLNY